MKYYQLIILVLVITYSGCGASIDYVKTGQEYPELNDKSQVKIYKIDNLPSDFEEIGFVLTKEGTYEDRLDITLEKARKVGGNGIIPQESVIKQKTNQVPIYGMGSPIYGMNGQIVGHHRQVVGYRPVTHTWTEQKFVIIRVNNNEKVSTK